MAALGSRLLDGGFDVQQQVFHLCCPSLLLLFLQKDQLAQMVNVAEGMLAEIEPIRLQAIMHTDPLEILEDADGVQSLFAPLGMDRIVGQVLGCTDMHPIALTCDIEAGFILMQHVGPTEGGFDLLLHWLQVLGTALHQRLQRPHAHRRSQQILHHLTRSFVGQQLLLHQVDAYCPKGSSILHGCTHVVRESSTADLLTGGAALRFGLVFDYQHALGRQIEDLSAFHLQTPHLAQIVLTVQAVLDRMHDHRIRQRRELQRGSCMTGLSSRLLAAFGAQTLGLSMKAIRRRRQVTVVAIFSELGFQHRDAFAQQRHLLSQGCILFSQLLQFFVFGHAASLLASLQKSEPLVLLDSYFF